MKYLLLLLASCAPASEFSAADVQAHEIEHRQRMGEMRRRVEWSQPAPATAPSWRFTPSSHVPVSHYEPPKHVPGELELGGRLRRILQSSGLNDGLDCRSSREWWPGRARALGL